MADWNSLITIILGLVVIRAASRRPRRPLTFMRRVVRGWLPVRRDLRLVVRYGRAR